VVVVVTVGGGGVGALIVVVLDGWALAAFALRADVAPPQPFTALDRATVPAINDSRARHPAWVFWVRRLRCIQGLSSEPLSADGENAETVLGAPRCRLSADAQRRLR
jgi:hypothetical protein